MSQFILNVIFLMETNYSLCINVQNPRNVGDKQRFIIWCGGHEKEIVLKQLLYER